MMAGSHLALGAAAWVAVAPRLGAEPLAPVGLGLALLGSLLPDIDHPKSWAGRRLRPVSTLLAALVGHRGVTHSALAVLACWWLLTRPWVPVGWAAPVLVGYLSHLAGDLLTPAGLRLAWPLRGTWALPLCRAGSPFEPVVVALALYLAWASLPDGARPRAALLDRTLARLGLCPTCLIAALPPPPPPAPRPPRLLVAARG